VVNEVKTNQFLIEVDTFDDVTAGIIVERFATGASGFQTQKSETPSRAKYQPFLKDAGNVEQSLFGRNKSEGRFSVGAGNVVITNADGQFNRLEDRGIDGRDIVIRERVTIPYPSGAPIRFSGLVSTVIFSNLTTTFNIRSRLNNLRTTAFQPEKYAGTNDTSSIFVEGDSDGIKGLAKPKVVADLSENFEPILVEEALEIYQVSSDPCKLEVVYVGRSLPTKGTVHTTFSAFITAVQGGVAAGTYISYEGDYDFDEGNEERGCYFAVGTTPSKRVTVDARVVIVNILNNSNKFDTGSWTKTNSTVTGQTIADPIETTKATDFLEDSTASAEHSMHQDITVLADKSHAHSIYVKPKGRTKVTFTVGDTGLTDKIELSVTLAGSGTIDSITASGVAGSETGKITLVDEGFYRIEIVGEINGSHVTLRHKLNLLDAGGSATYTGDGTSGVTIWQSETSIGKIVFPVYESTGGAASGFKNTIGQSVFRVMQEKGFVLDPLSVVKLDQRHVTLFSTDFGLVQNFRGTREAKTSDIIDEFIISSHAFLLATLTETFEIGQWELPTVSESELTVDNKILLGRPKIKKIQIADRDKGVPTHTVNINYRENYSIMSATDIFGVAEKTDLPFISKEFRVETGTTAATLVKHLSSGEKNIETKLISSADAVDLVQFELDLYDVQRTMVEIKIPRQFGKDLEPGDVITLESKLYRVNLKRTRFPNASKRDITTQALSFQAWGGISI